MRATEEEIPIAQEGEGCDHGHKVEEEEDEEYEEEEEIDEEVEEESEDEAAWDPEELALLHSVDGPGDIDDDEPIVNDSDADTDDDEEVGADTVGAKRAKATRQRGPSQSAKRQCRRATQTAEQWLHQCNQTCPVAEDDEGMHRFQKGIAKLIQRLCEWARSEADESIGDWMNKDPTDRAMTRGYRQMLLRVGHEELTEEILQHMPRKSQQVLGKKDLDPVDLWEMPEVPNDFLHRLTYLDVPMRVGIQNIEQGLSKLARGKMVKAVKANVNIQASMEAKVYVGSSLDPRGGQKRLQVHEYETNRPSTPRTDTLHYRFTRQDEVVPHFLLAGAWSNPSAVEEDGDQSQDLKRALPHFLEGLLMVYLGTYDLVNRCTTGSSARHFPDASYTLTKELRRDLELPQLSSASLNRAWPLVQGVPGGMIKAHCCANEECGRVKVKEVPAGGRFTTTTALYAVHGPFSPRFCRGCYLFAKKNNGLLRTREGSTNGYFGTELAHSRNAINEGWFADGNERQCHNTECKVSIPKSANLYGFKNGIRCKRCYDYAWKFKKEWNQSQQPGKQQQEEDPTSCDSCNSPASTVYTWDQEKLCLNCNTTRCCFGNNEGTQSKPARTIPSCANAACQTDKRQLKGFTFLIEDIELDIWRCLVCDWAYSVYNTEVPGAFEKAPEDACPPGLIRHHRFNATSCVDCGRYVTSSEWTPVEGGGFKCGSCFAPRCSNNQCGRHPALTTSNMHWDKDVENWFCQVCYRRLAQQARQGRPKKQHFASYRVVAVPQDRRCVNPACDRTASNCTSWCFVKGHRNDEAFVRCGPCHRVFRVQGVERVPGVGHLTTNGKERVVGGIPTTRECFNPYCDRTAATQPRGWRIVEGFEGCYRCAYCHYYYMDTGDERQPRPKPPGCVNPNCDRTRENYEGQYKYQAGHHDDPAYYRCGRCHNTFAKQNTEWVLR